MAREAEDGMNGPPYKDSAISLTVTFLMPRPKLHYRANGELKSWAPTWHRGKPDLDNLLKAVKDALTGIVYSDDCLISVCNAQKLYGEDRPGALIRVTHA